MKPIKIPSTILDVYHEMAACRQLAKEHDTGWFPSLKAIMYTAKAEKLHRFADRAMQNAFPQVKVHANWEVNIEAGLLICEDVVVENVVKKVRKPRAVPVPTDLPK